MAYQIRILDANLSFKGIIKNLDDLDRERTYLKYGHQLSHWGTAQFRVGTKDPLFTKVGDLVAPLKNHVQILRNGTVVWQGIIIANKNRNPFFIDVEAATYEWLFNKVLVRHDTSTAYPTDANNYMHITTGTMAEAVQTILTNAQADAGGVIQKITAGTILNPNFPTGFKDINGNDISGQAWDFSKIPIKFNYVSAYYVLNTLGAYAKYDFYIDLNKRLNFQPVVGATQTNVVFSYGPYGQVEDYNIVQSGDKVVNYLIGLAADDSGNVLTSTQLIQSSITTYGMKLMGVAAYADIKAQSYLDQRTKIEANYSANIPSEVQLTLNKRANPIGQWNLGDIVTVQINDKVNQFNKPQQIVRYEVDVKDSGMEQIKLFTNDPLPDTY